MRPKCSSFTIARPYINGPPRSRIARKSFSNRCAAPIRARAPSPRAECVRRKTLVFSKTCGSSNGEFASERTRGPQRGPPAGRSRTALERELCATQSRVAQVEELLHLSQSQLIECESKLIQSQENEIQSQNREIEATSARSRPTSARSRPGIESKSCGIASTDSNLIRCWGPPCAADAVSDGSYKPAALDASPDENGLEEYTTPLG